MTMTNENANALVSPERAAEMLGVPLEKLFEWIATGDLVPATNANGLYFREGELLSAETRSWFQRGCELSANPLTVEEAASCFRRAIDLNPLFNIAWFELGRMYYTWGRYYEAKEPLGKTIELNPCFPAYINYGLSSNLWGEYREAEYAFREGLRIMPNHAEALYQLGFAIMMTSYYDPTRTREAIDYFRSTLSNRPDHALAAHFLGSCLVIRLGAFAEAEIFANEISEKLPDEAEYVHRIIEINKPARTFSQRV
jgi:tetratricopeptide (TPR) repeat protein